MLGELVVGGYFGAFLGHGSLHKMMGRITCARLIWTGLDWNGLNGGEMR
jgi:hypothetical protein